MVAANPTEWISIGFALGKFSFDLLEMLLPGSAAVVAEGVPLGQFLNGVAEKVE